MVKCQHYARIAQLNRTMPYLQWMSPSSIIEWLLFDLLITWDILKALKCEKIEKITEKTRISVASLTFVTTSLKMQICQLWGRTDSVESGLRRKNKEEKSKYLSMIIISQTLSLIKQNYLVWAFTNALFLAAFLLCQHLILLDNKEKKM